MRAIRISDVMIGIKIRPISQYAFQSFLPTIMPIVEIVQFSGSDEFIADPTIFNSALDILIKAHGLIR